MLTSLIHHAARAIVLFVRDVAVLVVAYTIVTGRGCSLPEFGKQEEMNPVSPMLYNNLIVEKANKYGIPPTLFVAQIYQESKGDANAVSKRGAAGLGQLMPIIQGWCGLADPFDPADNLDCSAKFMSMLLEKYQDEKLALAAYNAGEPAVDACHCIPQNGETPAYVSTVLVYAEQFGNVVAFSHIYDTAVFSQRNLHGLNGYEGVDVVAGCDAPILAPFTGEVVYNGRDGYVGPFSGGEQNTMLVFKSLTDNLNVTLLHGRYTAQGIVRQGDVLGYEASEGNSTGCHSHVIVYQDRVNVTDTFAERLIK
jgi:murein DD-endopeptidase MepM/ murein hydrolase activator NlpD